MVTGPEIVPVPPRMPPVCTWTGPVPRAGPLANRVPPETVVPPVYVLVPVRVRAPAPDLTSARLPLMTPLNDPAAALFTVNVRAAARLLVMMLLVAVLA